MNSTLSTIVLACLIFSCSESKLEKNSIPLTDLKRNEQSGIIYGLYADSLDVESRPRNVLLTGNDEHRLTPIYKVDYDKRTNRPIIGSNHFHTSYWEFDEGEGNQWHYNIMPGFEAVYGDNLINISHFNNRTQTENRFFDNSVIVKTLYYPAFSKDTLYHQPVLRSHYMVSVYDEDTNKDGLINSIDLRRFYFFDIDGENKKALVPKNYSVLNSEYDPANDFMYVYAKLDQNENGQMDYGEAVHIFWIDLKNPGRTGRQY